VAAQALTRRRGEAQSQRRLSRLGAGAGGCRGRAGSSRCAGPQHGGLVEPDAHAQATGQRGREVLACGNEAASRGRPRNTGKRSAPPGTRTAVRVRPGQPIRKAGPVLTLIIIVLLLLILLGGFGFSRRGRRGV